MRKRLVIAALVIAAWLGYFAYQRHHIDQLMDPGRIEGG